MTLYSYRELIKNCSGILCIVVVSIVLFEISWIEDYKYKRNLM